MSTYHPDTDQPDTLRRLRNLYVRDLKLRFQFSSHGAGRHSVQVFLGPNLVGDHDLPLPEGVGEMSRSAARRQAHRESHMYRKGSGWIVSTWDETVRCNRVTGELTWPEARQRLADWRANRARQLQGLPAEA